MSIKRIEVHDDNKTQVREDKSFFMGYSDEEVDEFICKKTIELRDEIKTLNLEIKTLNLENQRYKDTICSITTKTYADEKELDKLRIENDDFKRIRNKYMHVALLCVVFSFVSSEKCLFAMFLNLSRLTNIIEYINILKEWINKPYRESDGFNLVFMGPIEAAITRTVFILIILLLIFSMIYGSIYVCKKYRERWCILSLMVLCFSTFIVVEIVNWSAKGTNMYPVIWIIMIQIVYLVILNLIDAIAKRNEKTETWESFQSGNFMRKK